jgi:hypothetical protein
MTAIARQAQRRVLGVLGDTWPFIGSLLAVSSARSDGTIKSTTPYVNPVSYIVRVCVTKRLVFFVFALCQ